MSEFESRRGEFANLSNEDRRRLIVRLCSIIKDSIMLGVGASLIRKDYQKAIVPFLTENDDVRRAPYLLALQTCLEDIVTHLEIPPNEGVALICDENLMFKGIAAEFFPELRKLKGWDGMFPSLTFGQTRQFVPLQSADILAYESFKFVTNQVLQEVEKPIRKRYQSLVKSKRMTLGYWNEDALARLNDKVQGLALLIEGRPTGRAFSG